MVFLLFFLSVVMVIMILLGIAFVTLFEREILGLSQNRLGPNKIIFLGLLQALLDGLKLVKKEFIFPKSSSDFLFMFIPLLSFLIMYLEWFLLPFMGGFMNWQFSMIFFFCLVGMMVYTSLLSGLMSKSKYAFLGAVRSSSQSISFEVVFSLFFMGMMVFLKSFEMMKLFNFFNFVFFFIFVLMILVELNRAPFDFSEGESELVSGYNVEYSGFSFALLFLAEYGSLLFFSVLMSILFFNNSIIMISFNFMVLLLIRSAFPRFRYDFLMNIFWFKILPVSILYFFFIFIFIV